MKRRKAMHYLRKMIKNPAIAYMLTYLEETTDLRKESVRIYRQYWKYMESDTIILPELDPDSVKPKENTINMVMFTKLRTNNPKCYIMRDVYPASMSTIRDNEVCLNFKCSTFRNDSIEIASNQLLKVYDAWINGLKESE